MGSRDIIEYAVVYTVVEFSGILLVGTSQE